MGNASRGRMLLARLRLWPRDPREINWEGWDPPQPVLCEVEIPLLPGPAGG